MSDVMLFGVLRMPYEMAMGGELSRRQFYARAQEAVDRLEAAERDAARYRWLRNQATAGVMTTPCHGSLNCDEPESEWDAWIDAAAQEGE